MKKFSLLVMISMLAVASAAVPALAQEDTPEGKCYQEWYDAAQNKKDIPLAAKLGKGCLEKFPQSQYAKFWKQSINKYVAQLQQTFYNTLKDVNQDPTKIEKLITDGQAVLEWKPDDVGVPIYTALATTYVAMLNNKDLDRAKTYSEKALQIVENPTVPPDVPKDQYEALRETAKAKLNQYMGFYYLKQNPPNYDQGETYLTKSIGIKSKGAGEGWKDANNYYMRTEVYTKQYDTLRAEYDALSEDDKRGPKGTAILDKIAPIVEKLIMDYARVVALATDPRAKALQDDAKERLESFWKFRQEGKTDGMMAYVKGFEADPTVNQPLPPAPEKAPDKAPQPAPGKPPVKGKPGKPSGR